MPTRYPAAITLRLSREDEARLLDLAEATDRPPATLLRRFVLEGLHRHGNPAASDLRLPAAEERG